MATDRNFDEKAGGCTPQMVEKYTGHLWERYGN